MFCNFVLTNFIFFLSPEIPEWLQVYAKASPEYDCFLKVTILHFSLYLARIQVFRRGGSTKLGCRRRRPNRGSEGIPPVKFLNFKSSGTQFLPF